MRRKNNSVLILITMILLPVGACHRDEKAQQKIMDLKKGKSASDYTVRLAEMSYLTDKKPDRTFSAGLIRDLIREEYFSEARYAIDHLLKVYGPDANLYYLEAVCYRNQHEFIPASDEIQKALTLESGNGTYRNEKENILEAKKRWMSLDSLDTMISKDKYNYTLKLQRAEQLFGMREFEAAVYDADTVLNADSANLEARFVRGTSFLLDKKFDQALDDFKILASHTEAKDHKQYIYYYKAAQNIKQNADLIERNPSLPEAYINMARALSEISEFSTAISILDKGLQVIPDNNGLSYAKLLVFLQSGNRNSARDIMYSLEAKGFRVDAAVKKTLQIDGR